MGAVCTCSSETLGLEQACNLIHTRTASAPASSLVPTLPFHLPSLLTLLSPSWAGFSIGMLVAKCHLFVVPTKVAGAERSLEGPLEFLGFLPVMIVL